MNQLLTEYGHNIAARLGVNVERKCVDHCPGIISLVMESERAQAEELTKKLNEIPEIKAELCVMSEE
jgi:hypothetical protein